MTLQYNIKTITVWNCYHKQQRSYISWISFPTKLLKLLIQVKVLRAQKMHIVYCFKVFTGWEDLSVLDWPRYFCVVQK